jgi:nitrate reductase alpha subunit
MEPRERQPARASAKYTFHRVPALHEASIASGLTRWAEAFRADVRAPPTLFDRRGEDTFVQVSWDQAFRYISRALIAIAQQYSGEAGAKRLLAQGYQPEMVAAMGGAGTRALKMRGGMGLLGVLGKYGMYRFNNSMALLDAGIRGVGPEEAKAGRNFSNYTWHGDQAPGHPWVHGLQASDCDFNDLRFSKLIILDGKNLVENKLADSHWFIECMERGARSWSSPVQSAPTRQTTGSIRPQPTRRCFSGLRAT